MNTSNIKVKTLVTVEGYISRVVKVYEAHAEVVINFHGKLIQTVVEISKCKEVVKKAKYTKDEQVKMFGRVFSTGFIQLHLVNFDHDNVWDLEGFALHMWTARKVDCITLEATRKLPNVKH